MERGKHGGAEHMLVGMNVASLIYRTLEVCRKLQHALTIAPTHFIKCVGMSKSYDRSILLHVGACDANKP